MKCNFVLLSRSFQLFVPCRCLGSTQRLKSTYGSGYTLEIKLAPPQNSDTSTGEMMKRLQDYVKQLLPGATQVEVFGGRVTYKVPREYIIALSTIFDALERGTYESFVFVIF